MNIIDNGGKTGHPPGLLQDDSAKLTTWFASRIDARQTVRKVCREIAEERNTLQARRDYDSRGLTPLRRPSVIHLSWVGRLLAWIGRWA